MVAFSEILIKYGGVKKIEAGKLGKAIPDEDTLYEVLGQLDSGVSVKEIHTILKKKETGWDMPTFKELRDERERSDNLVENPPQPREGEFKCPKCKSLKTMATWEQTRSADEGLTYTLHCFNPNCKAKTKISS